MKLLPFLLGSPVFAATLLKVACGGPGGAGWVPDTPYAIGGSTQAVAGVQPLPYSFLRYAPPNVPIRYSFSVAGINSVTLFFIEPRFNQTAGQRLFTISINGAPVSTNLDLFVSAGALVPTSFTFPVSSPSGTGSPLTIAFLSTQGNAVVSGIQLDGTPPAPPVSGLSLECPSGTVGFAALTAAAASQDVVVMPAMPESYRFLIVYLRELVQFTGPLASLTVSIRAGSMDLTSPLSLKVAGGLNVWQDRPGSPVGLPVYDVALHFTGSAALAGGLDGGGLYWQVCGFNSAGAAALPVARINPRCIPNDGLAAQSRFTKDGPDPEVDCYECQVIRDLGKVDGKPIITILGDSTIRQFRVRSDPPGECRVL